MLKLWFCSLGHVRLLKYPGRAEQHPIWTRTRFPTGSSDWMNGLRLIYSQIVPNRNYTVDTPGEEIESPLQRLVFNSRNGPFRPQWCGWFISIRLYFIQCPIGGTNARWWMREWTMTIDFVIDILMGLTTILCLVGERTISVRLNELVATYILWVVLFGWLQQKDDSNPQ